MDEEVHVNRDKNGEADGMNLEVDSKDEMMRYINERSVIFKEEMVGSQSRTVSSANTVIPLRW